MSNATVISTLPFDIKEPKPGLIPCYFEIPKAEIGGISLLHVIDAIHLIPITGVDSEMPAIRVPDPAEKVAKAIVEDFLNSMIATDREVREDGSMAIPGIFWISSRKTEPAIKAEHKDELELAFKNTKTWFKKLVQIADDDWAMNRQYKFITDLSRMGCKYLGLKREWVYEQQMEEQTTKCPACYSVVDPRATICFNCKTELKKQKVS